MTDDGPLFSAAQAPRKRPRTRKAAAASPPPDLRPVQVYRVRVTTDLIVAARDAAEARAAVGSDLPWHSVGEVTRVTTREGCSEDELDAVPWVGATCHDERRTVAELLEVSR